MWEERIGLEHQPDGAFVGRNAGNIGAIEIDPPGSHRHQPGDGAHRRGLAAAGGPEKCEQFALADIEIEILDGDIAAIGERDFLQ